MARLTLRRGSRRKRLRGLLWAVGAVLFAAWLLLAGPAAAKPTSSGPRVYGGNRAQSSKEGKNRRTSQPVKVWHGDHGAGKGEDGQRKTFDLATEPFLEFKSVQLTKTKTPRQALMCVGASCQEARTELPRTMLCINRLINSPSMLQQWADRQPERFRPGYNIQQRVANIEGCNDNCPPWVCHAQMSQKWSLEWFKVDCQDAPSGVRGVTKVADTCRLMYSIQRSGPQDGKGASAHSAKQTAEPERAPAPQNKHGVQAQTLSTASPHATDHTGLAREVSVEESPELRVEDWDAKAKKLPSDQQLPSAQQRPGLHEEEWTAQGPSRNQREARRARKAFPGGETAKEESDVPAHPAARESKLEDAQADNQRTASPTTARSSARMEEEEWNVSGAREGPPATPKAAQTAEGGQHPDGAGAVAGRERGGAAGAVETGASAEEREGAKVAAGERGRGGKVKKALPAYYKDPLERGGKEGAGEADRGETQDDGGRKSGVEEQARGEQKSEEGSDRGAEGAVGNAGQEQLQARREAEDRRGQTGGEAGGGQGAAADGGGKAGKARHERGGQQGGGGEGAQKKAGGDEDGSIASIFKGLDKEKEREKRKAEEEKEEEKEEERSIASIFKGLEKEGEKRKGAGDREGRRFGRAAEGLGAQEKRHSSAESSPHSSASGLRSTVEGQKTAELAGAGSLWYAGIATASIAVASSAWFGYVHYRGALVVSKKVEKKRRSKKKGSGKGGGETARGGEAVMQCSSEEEAAEPRKSTESQVSRASEEEDRDRAKQTGSKGKKKGALASARLPENGGGEAKERKESSPARAPSEPLSERRKLSAEGNGSDVSKAGKGKGKAAMAAAGGAMSASSEEECGGDKGSEREEGKGNKKKGAGPHAAQGRSEEEGQTDGWKEARTVRGKRRTLEAAPEAAQPAPADKGAEPPAPKEAAKARKALVVTLPRGHPAVPDGSQVHDVGAGEGAAGGGAHAWQAAAAEAKAEAARPAGSGNAQGEGAQAEEDDGLCRRASQELMSLLGIGGTPSAGSGASRAGEGNLPSPGATIMAMLGHARVGSRPNSVGEGAGQGHSPLGREDGAAQGRAESVGSTANGVDPTCTPKLRKRRPRRDLDFSMCHPCGLYNGSGTMLENLCFFNAAIQLLFHAIKDLAADLNRCTGAVALAVRGLGEEVIKLQPADGTSEKAGEVSKETSEQLRSTLSAHFSYLECPPARQSQCDAYEFLEGLLEVVREDVRENGGVVDDGEKKSVNKRLHEKMGVVAQESRREPVLCASLLDSLHNMADLKWAMDMHGRPDAAEQKPSSVTFAGQMITLTYDQAKRGLRRCEFEPFSVWALPLQGESGGSPPDGVCLEQLLVSYCRAAAPEGGEGLLRRTALWRLPDSLVICLRRFDNRCHKLPTAVRVPPTLDFSRGTPKPSACAAEPEKEVCVFGGGFGAGAATQGAQLGDGCTYHVQASSTEEASCRSSPAYEEGATYDLSGVCYHLGGTLDNGHYVAAVKGRGGAWWECNDSQCGQVKMEQVLAGTVPSVQAWESYPSCSRTVYVMVYRKR